MYSNPISQVSASRDCLLCHLKIKDMKKHTILNHVANTWWGAYGPYTCWRCQEYHPGAQIISCDGHYREKEDLQAFLFRNKCLENFLKEDLQCKSDYDLISLIHNNNLCYGSISNFSARESEFMRKIDKSKNLAFKPIYNANNPSRISEMYHWRTLAELIKFSEINGIITGNTVPDDKISLVDSMVNIADPYIKQYHKEDLTSFIFANNPYSGPTSSVVTDISGRHLLDTKLIEKLTSDDSIKISVGINPKDVTLCNNQQIIEIEKLVTNFKVVAVGSTGLDYTQTSPIPTQAAIFVSMLKIAVRTKKPVRVVSKGLHSKTSQILKENLDRYHKIHYTNFELKPSEAVDFLINFPASYVGIPKKFLDSTHPGYKIINRITLKKLIPSSYAFMDNSDPDYMCFDLEGLVTEIGRIKGTDRQSVVRQLRLNIKNLYYF